jgi:small GTP-binding protein
MAQPVEPQAPINEYSIAVMGPGAVGKSALILQYTKGVFVRDYDPTIEDAYRKTEKLEDGTYLLDILDTAGQEEYLALRSAWMRERDGFLLVFSLIDAKSLNELVTFIKQIETIYEGTTPTIVLVGNKCDLGDQRKITPERAQEVAQANGCQYFEVSAKTGENIMTVFHSLIRGISVEHHKRDEALRVAEAVKPRRRFCTLL